jgi:hypothetical protein
MLHTVAETDVFKRYAALIWSDLERTEFVNWIAANSRAGDVIPGSGGCRKVRWSRSGMGKRGAGHRFQRNGWPYLVIDCLCQGKIR